MRVKTKSEQDAERGKEKNLKYLQRYQKSLARKTNCFHVDQLTTHSLARACRDHTKDFNIFFRKLRCLQNSIFSFNYKTFFLCVFGWLPSSHSLEHMKKIISWNFSPDHDDEMEFSYRCSVWWMKKTILPEKKNAES